MTPVWKPQITLPRGVRRLFRLPESRDRLMRDADEEAEFHLDMWRAEFRAQGMSDVDADAEARRRFGDASEYRDYSARRALHKTHRQGVTDWLAEWMQDVRLAIRHVRAAPGFAAIAVLTLALGIGANAAIFSVVHRLLLAPLPYSDGNRIVMLAAADGERIDFPSVATLRLIRARSRSIETLAAVSVQATMVQNDDGQDTVYAFVTPTYLKMLGVAPSLDRAFTAAEAHDGARVAMISYGRWQREFGGRANAVGSTVEINYDRREGSERRRYTVTVSLPFYRWHLTAARPIPGYPENLDGLGDHIRKTRLDRRLNRKTTAGQLRIDAVSLKNWEDARTAIDVRFYPRILSWLGYDPMPQARSLGDQIRHARLSRGWSRKRLAYIADVDEGTVKRLETNTPNMARRPRGRVLRTLLLSI
jgi:hypothetical protein